jgi:DHA2 family multidrug resistance protein
VGILVSRVDARYMIGFGFLMLSGSLFYMTRHLYTGIDFRTAVELRLIQSIGLPFLFIPINTLVYAGVAPEKNNAVSGIVNLSRNMGGDIGIAAVTTLIARRSQFHQSVLVTRANNFDPNFTARLEGLARSFERAGASALDATHKALNVIYFQVQQQAATLAFLDAIKMLAVATGLMIPLLFFTQRARPGGAPAGGH